MVKRLLSLTLSPAGRINRQTFLLGLAILIVFVIAQRFIYPYFGTGLGQFWGGMIFFFLNLHILMCIYGKRLHDIGRGLWPFVGLICLTLFIALIVMLNYGGLEYFNGLYDNPEIVEDTAAMERLHETYRTKLAAARPIADIVIGGLPIVFTAWLALAKGQPGNNRYGPALS